MDACSICQSAARKKCRLCVKKLCSENCFYHVLHREACLHAFLINRRRRQGVVNMANLTFDTDTSTTATAAAGTSSSSASPSLASSSSASSSSASSSSASSSSSTSSSSPSSYSQTKRMRREPPPTHLPKD